MDHNQLCEAISQIIRNYADNRYGVYDSVHVNRWIEQFDVNERQLVLEETLHILQSHYITKEQFIDFVSTTIDFDNIHKGNPQQFWGNASLLQIQRNGNSQNELNHIFSSVLQNKYQVGNIINKLSQDYFYVDDFIFSGNRLYDDIRQWIELNNPINCNLNIVTIGYYTSGQYSTECKLRKLFENRNIKLNFYSYNEHVLENRLSSRDSSERFWPTVRVLEDATIQAYVANNEPNFTFRTIIPHKNKVFSSERREQYEKIMLKYGIRIVGFPRNNNIVVKPLGYDTYPTFGFGSAVFTFRNCPNNNPLAFWWGDPNAPKNHPFSQWYPLLQRTAYRD
ncbi:hypothetical protein CW749_22530 [Vibrio sp. vnigr-6D03]|uniref:phosphoribosyltransferase-like protein n=1 Tax=Vibrio sp. vnigr-6D03 TaxID=2058088 RepID=UPI000C34B1C6|nr:hypothetical protein [Vibrio sp. vnigr-6D03]PKF77331.1 hypothetical protein CW749_22530 [Vibrio sp. vnigr-6D03]